MRGEGIHSQQGKGLGKWPTLVWEPLRLLIGAWRAQLPKNNKWEKRDWKKLKKLVDKHWEKTTWPVMKTFADSSPHCIITAVCSSRNVCRYYCVLHKRPRDRTMLKMFFQRQEKLHQTEEQHKGIQIRIGTFINKGTFYTEGIFFLIFLKTCSCVALNNIP